MGFWVTPNTIIMKTIHEFEVFFYKDIQPILKKLDSRRRGIVGRLAVVIFLVLWLLFIAYVVIYHTDTLETSNPIEYYIPTGLLIVFLGILAGSKFASSKTFRLDFKRAVIEPIIQFINPNLSYSPQGSVSNESFNHSRLSLYSSNRHMGEDLVEGIIGNALVKLSEAVFMYVIHRRTAKRKEIVHDLFRGLFFVADFGVKFQKATIIIPRKGRQKIGMLKPYRERTEQLFKINHPEFNREFDVYTEDPAEAKLLLTNSFLQRVIDLRQKQSGNVSLSFVDSFLFIALEKNVNLLEPPLFKKLTGLDVVKPYFEQVLLMVSLLDELNPSR
jgi:hypothetical protein